MKNVKTILVTGGAGYIGSVTTELLIKLGLQVVVVDNLSTGHLLAVHPKAKFFQVSIGDKFQLDQIFKKYSIDSVIHFAAKTLVSQANTHPQEYYKTNVSDALSLLEVMLENNCKKIIFSSSAAVYGNPNSIPISESHALSPLNAYGESKMMFEKILFRYSQSYNLKAICFRYFNPAGSSSSYKELHNPETHLIPLILKSISSKKPIHIFGNTYPTRDGTCVRDYLHVLDVASAHILALSKIDGYSYEIFNLGNERGYTVKEVIATVQKITGKSIKTVIGPARTGDPHTIIASAEKAKKNLGWKPSHSTLEEIISSN